MTRAEFLSRARGQRFSTRTLTAMALLAAVSVVLARLIMPMPNETTRFSIEAVPMILAGFFFGPIPGALVGLVADCVGCLFSGYGYNPLFSVPPVMVGLCAGMLRPLLLPKVTYLRILLSFLPAVVIGLVLWQSYWLSVIYGGKSFGAYLVFRSVQFAVTALVDAGVIYGLFRSGAFEKMRLWPPREWADRK